MGELKNIVYNPNSGLFEDCTNPLAHLTPAGVRRQKRQNNTYPMAAQMKPVINSIYISGGEHPREDSTIEFHWSVEKAQRVVITLPTGSVTEYSPVGKCQLVVPGKDFHIRLVAHNGKYTTQRTLFVKPERLPLVKRIAKWINN